MPQFAPHDSGFRGRIRVRPALNDAERARLRALASSGGTLRGTPTGRGDAAVPFARLAWEPCAEGCCLTWNPTLEASRMMLPSLRFVVDHLLRPGARADGLAAFRGFTFDHVLDGLVVADIRVVEVVANVVSERVLEAPCGEPVAARGRARKLPPNVIAFRPRRAGGLGAR
jgi:hypothetical protein